MPEVEVDGQRIELRAVRLDEIMDLRHEVLRHGLPRESAVFDGDNAPTSRHYAAIHDGRAVGCATLHLNQWEGEPAWQLRGMATDPPFRGRGVGRALLQWVESDARAAGPVRLLWCNARAPAVPFYQSQGWAIRSDLFDIPTAGPHRRMTKRLA